MESLTKTRSEGLRPLWKLLLIILFVVSVYLSLGFRGCNETHGDSTVNYVGAHGALYTVTYKYIDSTCIGWELDNKSADTVVQSGSNCGDAVPAVRAMTAGSGSAGAGPGGRAPARGLPPRARC